MHLPSRDPHPPVDCVKVNVLLLILLLYPYSQSVDYDVQTSTLTVLARILLRSGHQETARDLILASARLADDDAILLVVKEAIKLDDLSSPKVALIYQQRFRPMLQRRHPGALYLEGQRLESEGQAGRALEIYEEIVAADTSETFEVLSDVGAADIWKALGKLRAKNMDRKGAEAALRTAALQYNDPAALFQLAKVFTSPSTYEYESYMLKAAASGEAKATYELGLLYYQQSQASVAVARQASSMKLPLRTGEACNVAQHEGKTNHAVEVSAVTTKLKEAQEWFSIGAESGIIGSQVYLAILLRESGNLDDGLRWLTAAGNPEDVNSKEFHVWRPVISHIAKLWHDSNVDLARFDMNAIRRDGSTKPGSDKTTI